MFENLTVENIKKAIKDNKSVRLASYAVGGILVVSLGALAYWGFVYQPANEKSKEAGYVGLNYAALDSTDLAIEDLEPVVKKYDGKTGGEVAQFVLARQYMNKGDFNKALKTLEDVDVEDTYVRVHAEGLQGDCYSEMKNYDKAVDKYLSAAAMDRNEYTTPMYLFKAALLSENKLSDPVKATELYTEIKDNFLTFGNQKSIERYIERSKNKKIK